MYRIDDWYEGEERKGESRVGACGFHVGLFRRHLGACASEHYDHSWISEFLLVPHENEILRESDLTLKVPCLM